MKIIAILFGLVCGVIPKDDLEKYERTLSKRHPNRRREDVQAMALDHLGALLVDELEPDYTMTHKEMVKWLLNQPGNEEKSSNQLYAEVEGILTRSGRPVPDRKSLYSTISKVRRERGQWKYNRTRTMKTAKVSRDSTKS